jgi:hypothetical protein
MHDLWTLIIHAHASRTTWSLVDEFSAHQPHPIDINYLGLVKWTPINIVYFYTTPFASLHGNSFSMTLYNSIYTLYIYI